MSDYKDPIRQWTAVTDSKIPSFDKEMLRQDEEPLSDGEKEYRAETAKVDIFCFEYFRVFSVYNKYLFT